MNEWNIQSRAHACEVCNQPFVDQQAYHTVLFDEPAGLRRSDICEACASKVNDQRGRAGFISQWLGTYEAPPAQPVEAIQKDTADTLLRKLVELNDPRHAPAAFILAVMLERKRLLKVKEQFTRDGRRAGKGDTLRSVPRPRRGCRLRRVSCQECPGRSKMI